MEHIRDITQLMKVEICVYKDEHGIYNADLRYMDGEVIEHFSDYQSEQEAIKGVKHYIMGRGG